MSILAENFPDCSTREVSLWFKSQLPTIIIQEDIKILKFIKGLEKYPIFQLKEERFFDKFLVASPSLPLRRSKANQIVAIRGSKASIGAIRGSKAHKIVAKP